MPSPLVFGGLQVWCHCWSVGWVICWPGNSRDVSVPWRVNPLENGDDPLWVDRECFWNLGRFPSFFLRYKPCIYIYDIWYRYHTSISCIVGMFSQFSLKISSRQIRWFQRRRKPIEDKNQCEISCYIHICWLIPPSQYLLVTIRVFSKGFLLLGKGGKPNLHSLKTTRSQPPKFFIGNLVPR